MELCIETFFFIRCLFLYLFHFTLLSSNYRVKSTSVNLFRPCKDGCMTLQSEC